MSRGLSLWLVPEPRACAVLQARILSLAARYGGPRFLPHVTVFAGRFERDEDLLAVVREAADGEALELTVRGVETGAAFYRSVFVALAGTPRLQALSDRVGARAATSDFELDPHLSLFYGALSPARRAEVAAHAGDVPRVLRFSELVVNASPGTSGTPDGVSRWACTLRLPIRGG